MSAYLDTPAMQLKTPLIAFLITNILCSFSAASGSNFFEGQLAVNGSTYKVLKAHKKAVTLDVSGFSKESLTLLQKMNGLKGTFKTFESGQLEWAGFDYESRTAEPSTIYLLQDGVLGEGVIEAVKGSHFFSVKTATGFKKLSIQGVLEDTGMLGVFLNARNKENTSTPNWGLDHIKFRGFWADDRNSIELVLVHSALIVYGAGERGKEYPALVGGVVRAKSISQSDGSSYLEYFIQGPDHQEINLVVRKAGDIFGDSSEHLPERAGKNVVAMGALGKGESTSVIALDTRTLTKQEIFNLCNALLTD